MEFKTGQRVKVEYEGTVQGAGTTRISVLPDGGGYRMIDLTKNKVTLLDPPDWPPEAGDIWETSDGCRAEEWFAVTGLISGGIFMQPDNGEDGWSLKSNAERFKALNPVLVRRRGQ